MRLLPTPYCLTTYYLSRNLSKPTTPLAPGWSSALVSGAVFAWAGFSQALGGT